MEPEISADFLASEVSDHGITDAEYKALELALNGLSTADIAQRLRISDAAVRKRLGEVYRKFDIGRKGPGKLTLLRRKLLAAQSNLSAATTKRPPDLSNAPRISSFVGRKQELDTLCQWIRDDQCDLVALTGIGGIGKTTLALELAQQLTDDFDLIIWRSIRQFDSFQHLLESFPNDLSKPTLTALLELLAQKRCLLIFDQFEHLFRTNANPTVKSIEKKASRHLQAGVLESRRDREEHGDVDSYRELLEEISSARHRNSHHSCVLIASREKPRELIASEGDQLKVRLFTLTGLGGSDAEDILDQTGLQGGTHLERRQLIGSYAGNPLALKLAATTIKDLFAGSIEQFLEQKQLVFDDLRDILRQQFSRLSPLEEETMYWLAINGLPTAFHNLQADIVSRSNRKDLVYTLRSLEHRSLIEVVGQGSGFKLQPIVMEYVKQHLVKRIVKDLTESAKTKSASVSGNLLLNSHSLLKANADSFTQQRQTDTLLIPVLDSLKQKYGSAKNTQHQLETILEIHRQNPAYKTGYLGGNLFNLMAELSKEITESKDLSHKNFSDLAIWQADLEGVKLTGTKFNNCNLEKSVFTDTLSDVVTVGFTNRSDSFKSPSDAYFAAADINGHIHIWNLKTHQKWAYWQAHISWVRSLAFNRDNTLIATGGDDSTLKIWRFQSHMGSTPHLGNITLEWEDRNFPDWVRSVAFHPDQAIVACCSRSTIYLFYEADDHEAGHQAGDKISSFGPIAPEKFIARTEETIRYITFSFDGDLIASCGDDNHVRVWNWRTGQQLSSKALTHDDWARSLAFVPQTQYLVSSSDDQTIRIWDLTSHELVKTLRHHTDRVRSVAVSPDGRYMVSGSDDGNVVLWDLETKTPLTTSLIHHSRVWSVAFYQTPNETLLVSGGDDRSVVLSRIEGEGSQIRSIKILRGFAMGTRSVAVLRRDAAENSDSEDLIVSGGNDWHVKLWQPFSGRDTPIRDLADHTGRVRSVAAHGKWVASAGDDGTVRIWDIETSACVKVFTGHPHWVRAVVFSPDGTLLASGADDKQIFLWQLPTGTKLYKLSEHKHWIRTLAFSPDGRYLASGGDDKQIFLWNTRNGRQQLKFEDRHEHRIRSVMFRPLSEAADGHQKLLLASGSDDKKIIIWDVQTGQCLKAFDDCHRAGVKAIAFTLDGNQMASGSDDQMIYLWDTSSPNPADWEPNLLEIPMPMGQPLGIQSLAFMSDGQHLVSCDRSDAIYITNIHTGESRPIKPPRPYEKMQIKNITGLDPVQRSNLKDLGAVDVDELNLSLGRKED
ncbi:WD40 domain-containing protein [Leptothoe spongobia]|uniref:Pentapeptide repeat-containing protein n=1 Tax=Leptothoe spongobia TAU-MAC 1115 TaxID=1967444 RepID=A0A947DCC7_9CYAN|nr:NB-ARC domain-containing protein [Leptothoe spongobia]MBT9314540.1 pentapeptide repeat-containing protein [Leptothoe spongobia TAU-MAC 1115]